MPPPPVAGTFTYSPAAGTTPAAGPTPSTSPSPHRIPNYTTATASVQLTVGQGHPLHHLAPPPAGVPYGTVLSGTQLDATSPVAGTFTYSPAAGTTPAVGTDTLNVTFTPTDPTSYTTATACVQLTVGKATPTITWTTPAAVPYGTVLSPPS